MRMIKMKFISVMIVALLLVGIGQAQNYMPEFTMEPGAGIEMDSTTPGDIEMWNGNIKNATFSPGFVAVVGGDRDNITSYDAIIKYDGSTYYGLDANGTLIASNATDPLKVLNDMTTYYATGTDCYKTIVLDIGTAATTTTTATLYSGLNIKIMNECLITSAIEQPFFATPAGGAYSRIKISGGRLLFNNAGSGTYTCGHIELYNTSYSEFSNIWTHMNVSYNISNVGGIVLDGTGYHAWLNYIHNCHLSRITLDSATDNWIYQNTVCSWETNRNAVVLGTSCHNNKITENHIIAPVRAGILIPEAVMGLSIIGNWIEPQDEYTAGEQQYGIFADGQIRASNIDSNRVTNLGMMGFNFNGGLYYSSVSGNMFYECNRNNVATNRAISFGSGSFNVLAGNRGYNSVSSTKAPFIYGTSYTSYVGNVVHGKFSDDIVNVGTGSSELGTIAVLT